MKTCSFLLLMIYNCFLFSSCSHKDKHEEKPSITINKTTITHDISAGTESMIISSNTDWTLAGSTDWLQIDKISGTKGSTTITLTFKENKGASPLTTDLVLTGKEVKEQKIHVVQNGSAAFIQTDRNIVVSEPSATKDSFTVVSNTDWELTIPATAGWLTTDRKSGTKGTTLVHLFFNPNTTTDTLKTDISLTSPSQISIPPLKVQVKHDGVAPSININTSSLQEKATGQVDSFIISTNTKWILNIPASAEWITADLRSGNAGTFKVHLNVAANKSETPRTADLSISSFSGSLPEKHLTITQDAAYAINNFLPSSGRAGTPVTITGRFESGKTPAVSLNGIPATVTGSDATYITFLVPEGATKGKITVTIDRISCISATEFVVTNTLSPVAAAGGGTYRDNISFVYQDKIYVGLGTNESGSYNRGFKIFDTQTNTWTDGASIPAEMSSRKSAICFVLNNMAYMGMGSSASGSLKDWWRFDPATNTWKQLTNYPAAGYGGAAFVVNGTAYVMGAPLADDGDIYQFDPAGNSNAGSWTLRKNNILSAIYTTSLTLGNYGYIIGGDMGADGFANEVNIYTPATNTLTIQFQDNTPALNDVPHLELNGNSFLFYSKTGASTAFQLNTTTNKLLDLHTTVPDTFIGQYNSAVVNGTGYIWTITGKVYTYLP